MLNLIGALFTHFKGFVLRKKEMQNSFSWAFQIPALSFKWIEIFVLLLLKWEKFCEYEIKALSEKAGEVLTGRTY